MSQRNIGDKTQTLKNKKLINALNQEIKTAESCRQ